MDYRNFKLCAFKDAPVDLFQYDGMTQAETHRDIQREWTELCEQLAV